VIVYDLNDEVLDRCRTAHQTYAHIYKQDLGATDSDIQETEGLLTFSTDLQQAVANADIVIEAIAEIPDLKNQFYQSMELHLPEHTILATSSLLVPPWMTVCS
jgi:3-hydroxyacyl-CoA dehydrogenase